MRLYFSLWLLFIIAFLLSEKLWLKAQFWTLIFLYSRKSYEIFSLCHDHIPPLILTSSWCIHFNSFSYISCLSSISLIFLFLSLVISYTTCFHCFLRSDKSLSCLSYVSFIIYFIFVSRNFLWFSESWIYLDSISYLIVCA